MAISQQDYQLKAGESIPDYNARIAGLRANDAPTPPPAPQNQTDQVNKALGGNFFDPSTGAPTKPFTPTQIGNPITPPNPQTTGNPAPTLPTPTAPVSHQSYLTSAQTDADAAAKALSDARDKALADNAQKQKDLQGKIDAASTNEVLALDEIKTLTQPFRADYEASQRDALHINENFEANQKLTDELNSLLTQGNDIIANTKNLPIASSVLNAKVNNTIADVAARSGVIQAVMAARNNQISVAETMIDRAVTAMNADRKDQLDYWSTMKIFYQGQKDDAGKALITLTSDQKSYIDDKIKSLQDDQKRLQANADAIKNAMTDPATAQAYGQAGVTLNDTPEQINAKLSKYAYTKELSTTSQDMAGKGYSSVLPGQSAPAGTQTITTTDSKGITHTWYTKKTTASNETEQKKADIASMSNAIQTRLGTDGFISPQDWQHAKQKWVSGGYSVADFDAIFDIYKNPKDTYL